MAFDIEKIIAKNYEGTFKNIEFKKSGLVLADNELYVPGYVASALGFDGVGNYFINNFLTPEMLKQKALPLNPFASCGQQLDFSKFSNDMSVGNYMDTWNNFNDNVIGPVNYKTLFPHSQFFLGIFDASGPDVDSGVAAEIVEYHHTGKGPIYGIKSGFRPAENVAAPINPAVRWFIDKVDKERGKFYNVPDAGLTSYNIFLEELGKYTAQTIERAK